MSTPARNFIKQASAFRACLRAAVGASSSNGAGPSSRGLASKVEVETETLSSKSPYPFSSSTTFPSSPHASTPPPANLLSPRKGAALLNHINTSLLNTPYGAYDPQSLCSTLFSRRHPTRIRAGSVVTVQSYTTPSRTSVSQFSGVLLGVRRRGVDTAFTLRNVVNRTGVEQTFKVCSPMIKDIKVVRRADGKRGNLRNLGRARVNYLRDRPGVMAQIAASLKTQTK